MNGKDVGQISNEDESCDLKKESSTVENADDSENDSTDCEDESADDSGNYFTDCEAEL